MKSFLLLSLALGFPMVVGSLVGAARAHDHELSPEEIAAFKSVAVVVTAAVKGSGLQERDMSAVDVALKSVDAETFSHIDESIDFKSLDEPKKAAVVRTLRSVTYLRKLRARTKSPGTLAYWLGDKSPMGVSNALQTLCAQPSGDDFRQVVTFLSTDSRPDIRLCAGIAAKFGVLFEGPHAAYSAVARNLLVDADPQVAAQFGRWHCCDFNDPKLIDRLIDRLEDSRPLTSQPHGFLSSGEKTVSGAFVNGLDAFLFLRNDFLHGNRGRSQDLAGTTDFKVIRDTWESDKELWLGRRNTPRYEKIHDGVVELEVGKVKSMICGKRTVNLCLRNFRLEPGDCQPTQALALEIEDSEVTTAEKFTVRSLPDQPFSRCVEAENSVFTARAIALPSRPGSCLVRLSLWFRVDPNLGDDE